VEAFEALGGIHLGPSRSHRVVYKHGMSIRPALILMEDQCDAIVEAVLPKAGLDPPELAFYNRTMVDIHTDEPDPEINAPRRQAPDTSSASDVSSLDTESQADNLANRRRHDFRQRTLRHISDKAMHKLPDDKDSFLQWEQLTEVELLQDPWCVDVLTIMRHLHMTEANRPVSADFCNYLQRCAVQGGESVKSEVLSGDAKTLIGQGLGCELYRHLLNVYKPVGPRRL
jgi:hypothetical protein